MPSKQARKRWRDKNKDSINAKAKEWRASAEGRVKSCLATSQCAARKWGWVGCSDSVAYLLNTLRSDCCICGRAEHTCKTRLALDHCHTTGKFRGWLCSDCNLMLGKARDSAVILRLAANYLDTQ